MDIKCKFCHEPWDMFELHEVVKCFKLKDKDSKVDYRQVTAWFYQFGCATFDQGWDGIVPTEQNCKPETQTEAEKTKSAGVELLQELLGDDVDGLASMTEDFEYMGML